MYKMCHGSLDGSWGDYLAPNRERRTGGSHDFKFIVPKGVKIFLDFFFFSRTITEWNNLPKETKKLLSVNLSLLLKARLCSLAFTSSFLVFNSSF